MTRETIFLDLGFDNSLEPAFRRVWDFIHASDGCNGYIYKRKFTNAVRAAHASPDSAGKEHAQGVFLRIRKQKNAIWLRRAIPYSSKDKAISELEILIDHAFTDWSQFEKTVKEWSLDPKRPKKPKVSHDFGDGIALPGGLPETNHSKF